MTNVRKSLTGMHFRLAVCAVAMHSICAAGPILKAQVPDDGAREIAKKTVWEAAQQEPNSSFLSAHRREDLEEIFRSVSPRRAPQIFEISSEGYEFKSNAVEYHFSVHGPFVHLVAVDPQSGDTFRVSGFKESQTEFNRLAKAYQVKLGNELQAKAYADLFLQVDPLHYRIVKTQYLLTLKQLAEREFAENYPDLKSAESGFSRWWTKNESALARISLDEDITATETGFALTFITLSGIAKNQSDEGPALLKVTIILSSSGNVDPPTFRRVALN